MRQIIFIIRQSKAILARSCEAGKAVKCGNRGLYTCDASTPLKAGTPVELAEIARVLVRFDHVASFIVNPNHSIV